MSDEGIDGRFCMPKPCKAHALKRSIPWIEDLRRTTLQTMAQKVGEGCASLFVAATSFATAHFTASLARAERKIATA